MFTGYTYNNIQINNLDVLLTKIGCLEIHFIISQNMSKMDIYYHRQVIWGTYQGAWFCSIMIRHSAKEIPWPCISSHSEILGMLIHPDHTVNVKSPDNPIQHMLCATLCQISIPVAIRYPNNYLFELNPSTKHYKIIFFYQIKENTNI
jgi:hypothetical protein